MMRQFPRDADFVVSRMSVPTIPLSSSQIRKRGFRTLTVGIGIFAAILFVMYWLSAHGYRFSFAAIAASLPFAYACIGFIELVTGAPYQRLAQSWMSLRGWQRGVLGTFIVVASLVIILCVATFFVMMFA
jgi:hypothetical protein